MAMSSTVLKVVTVGAAAAGVALLMAGARDDDDTAPRHAASVLAARATQSVDAQTGLRSVALPPGQAEIHARDRDMLHDGIVYAAEQ